MPSRTPDRNAASTRGRCGPAVPAGADPARPQLEAGRPSGGGLGAVPAVQAGPGRLGGDAQHLAQRLQQLRAGRRPAGPAARQPRTGGVRHQHRRAVAAPAAVVGDPGQPLVAVDEHAVEGVASPGCGQPAASASTGSNRAAQRGPLPGQRRVQDRPGLRVGHRQHHRRGRLAGHAQAGRAGATRSTSTRSTVRPRGVGQVGHQAAQPGAGRPAQRAGAALGACRAVDVEGVGPRPGQAAPLPVAHHRVEPGVGHREVRGADVDRPAGVLGRWPSGRRPARPGRAPAPAGRRRPGSGRSRCRRCPLRPRPPGASGQPATGAAGGAGHGTIAAVGRRRGRGIAGQHADRRLRATPTSA